MLYAGLLRFSYRVRRSKGAAAQGARLAMKGVFMSLKNKPLPKFEVSASYEKFAQGDIVMDAPDAGERDEGCCGECSQASAESVGAGANVEPFEASVDRVVTCVCSQNALREVLYKTLAFCGAPRTFDEVEDFIAAQDEFIYSHIIQEPFTLAHMLLNAGGLSQTPLDDAGNAISEESLAAMSDDEACDAVATYRLETTPAGAKAVELLAPERRIASQIAKVPHRADTYYALMAFCRTPRKFPEIEDFFKNTEGLAMDVVADSHKLSPDYYVDKLDRAGALVWRGAWALTEAGQRVLDAHEAGASRQ